MSTTIILIRHGETEWNRSGRWQGHADVPLSPAGLSQAHALAARLRHEQARFDHIYASDLARAFDTARIVATALDMTVQTLAELREINVGSWSGLTRAEITARFPGAFDTVFHAPDGETTAEFDARVGGAITALAQRHPGETLAIVTHGGTIRAMLRALLWRPGAEVQLPFIGNTSVTELRLDGSEWTAVRINDLAHIADEQAPDMLAPADTGTAV